MFIVGLSGGIACGKSCVSKYLWDNHGVYVIDCDKISRDIYNPGSSCHKKLKNDPIFMDDQNEIFDDLDRVDRRKLGEVVFSDKEKRKVLNDISGPAIRMHIMWQVFSRFCKGDRFVVIDAPTLFETQKLLSICRETMCVYSSNLSASYSAIQTSLKATLRSASNPKFQSKIKSNLLLIKLIIAATRALGRNKLIRW